MINPYWRYLRLGLCYIAISRTRFAAYLIWRKTIIMVARFLALVIILWQRKSWRRCASADSLIRPTFRDRLIRSGER